MDKRLRTSLQTSAEQFLSNATTQPFKSSKPLLKTLITALTKQPSSDLPIALNDAISRAISQFNGFPNNASSPVTPPTKRARRSSRAEKKQDDEATIRRVIVEKLQIYNFILRLCAFHPRNVFAASDLLPAAQLMHDNLILFDSDVNLLTDVAGLCEEWWKRGLSSRESLISQSLPVILSRSLTSKKKIDVCRVYALREGFTLFEFEDESIEDLKQLLIRCVISPLYLKTDEGRKFLAFIFGLNLQLVKEICAMIKCQIPFGRKSVLEAYGEIIFRAWKAVENELKHEIEKFLGNLFEGAIYASSGVLAASIRRVLGGFVSNRTTEGVEKLIFGLSEPVIFRSLQVANSNVRQNALHLLLDLFPLEDPDSTKEAKETLLQKQFFLLEKLLMDECADVRVVAVEGSCRILHCFWEVIPSSTITKVITKIFDDMTRDNCAEVRLSTVNGVVYMLGNPQCHEVLKVLLPRSGILISDSSSIVRSAFIDLLLQLNDIRNFHFHKVVGLDVLLSTLANDQALIARKITKLLIPSYFPSKVTDEEACKRFVSLVKRSPIAGGRFGEFAASEGASLKSLMKLFRVLIGLTLSSVKHGQEQIEGLFVAASQLCRNLVTDASFQSLLKEELSSDKLKNLFKVAPTPRAQSCVCDIISVTSPDHVDDLFNDCMGLIIECSGLSDSAERQAEVRSAHKMILSCGWFDDMLQVLADYLQKAAYGCHVNLGVELGNTVARSGTKRKIKSINRNISKSRHGSLRKSPNSGENSFLKDYEVAVGIAWQLKDLLLDENTRKDLLDSGALESAFQALKVVSEASVLHCRDCNFLSVYPLSAYTALALHISLRNIKPEVSKEKTMADLTMDHLLRCAYSAFGANDNATIDKVCSKSSKTSKVADDCSKESTSSQETTTSNMIKILTAILKFTVDATTMDLSHGYQERCLNFNKEYVKFIMEILRRYHASKCQLTEEALKDIFLCLKSSFTYGAKLVGMVLKTCEATSSQKAATELVHEMLNLIASVEEVLGYGYANRLATLAQPWIPDLIIALGSSYLMNQILEEDPIGFNSSEDVTIPKWLCTLARIELHELREASSDEETESDPHKHYFSAFTRLMKSMAQTLKANNMILDAIGKIFLLSASNALQRKNFNVILGLVHFVCVKLVRVEDREWKNLKLMLASIEEIYPKIEAEAEDLSNSDDDRHKLRSVRALLEPAWIGFMYNETRHSMGDE